MDAAQIAREKGYNSLIEIATKMRGRVGQHCEHVSPGCENCYAETNNHRCLPYNGTGLPYDRRSRNLVEAFVDEKALLQPLKWKTVKIHTPECDACAKESMRSEGHYGCKCPVRPRRIFVENQSDLFAEWVTDEMLDCIFAVTALCPQHIFQVLTKRPERMLAYLQGKIALRIQILFQHHISTEKWGRKAEKSRGVSLGAPVAWPFPNVWLGVSVENQAAADERIPLLLQMPAAVRFASCEPLLGPVSLEELPSHSGIGRHLAAFSNFRDKYADVKTGIDWVICGGESGPGARPMHPDWARRLRDQCAAAGVPFFFKQWGEWTEVGGGPPNIELVNEEPPIDSMNAVIHLNGHRPDCFNKMHDGESYRWMSRIGKKAAGALLDGVERKAFPEVRR
jgi:protein gp37